MPFFSNCHSLDNASNYVSNFCNAELFDHVDDDNFSFLFAKLLGRRYFIIFCVTPVLKLYKNAAPLSSFINEGSMMMHAEHQSETS